MLGVGPGTLSSNLDSSIDFYFLLLQSTYFIIQLLRSELQSGRPVKMMTHIHVVPKLLLALASEFHHMFLLSGA